MNLLDLKKEIKEEVTREIKAEYGKYINQFNAAAKVEIDNNKRLLEEMTRNNAERQEDWGKALLGHHQGVKVEMEQLRVQLESMKSQLPRDMREEMSDLTDALRQQLEARVALIAELQDKAHEEMKEVEKDKSDS